MARKRGAAASSSPTRSSTRGKGKASSPPTPKMRSGRWSDEEHELFVAGVEKHGRDWDKVAEHVGSRTVDQVKSHGQKHPDLDKKPASGTKSRRQNAASPARSSRSSRASTRGRHAKEDAAEEAETEEKEVEEEAPSPKKKQKVDKAKTKEKEAADDESETKKKDAAAKAAKEAEKEAAEKKKKQDDAAAKKKKKGEEPTKKAEKSKTPPRKKAATASSSPARSTPGVPPPPPTITPQQALPPGPYTNNDIVLPTMNEYIAGRPANREYIQLLQANCTLYHSMPSPEQMWFLTNMCNFLMVVRGRKIFNFHHWTGYRLMTEPPLPLMVAELNLDTFKRAAFQFNPFWLLGNHDPTNFHGGSPFLHRKLDGIWKRVSMDDVKTILEGEGPKNLLLLPAGLKFDDADGSGKGGDAKASS